MKMMRWVLQQKSFLVIQEEAWLQPGNLIEICSCANLRCFFPVIAKQQQQQQKTETKPTNQIIIIIMTTTTTIIIITKNKQTQNQIKHELSLNCFLLLSYLVSDEKHALPFFRIKLTCADSQVLGRCKRSTRRVRNDHTGNEMGGRNKSNEACVKFLRILMPSVCPSPVHYPTNKRWFSTVGSKCCRRQKKGLAWDSSPGGPRAHVLIGYLGLIPAYWLPLFKQETKGKYQGGNCSFILWQVTWNLVVTIIWL